MSRARRSKDNGRVADLDAVSAVAFEETVERGGVGEGGRFRNRSVVALLVAVGGKGVEIE